MSTLTNTIKTGLRAGVALAEKAVIASAVTALPLLGVPGINFLFSWGVHWVVDKIYPLLEVWFIDRAIDIQIQAELGAYEKARIELKAVLDTHVSDPKELEKASADFDDRLGKLIRFKP